MSQKLVTESKGSDGAAVPPVTVVLSLSDSASTGKADASRSLTRVSDGKTTPIAVSTDVLSVDPKKPISLSINDQKTVRTGPVGTHSGAAQLLSGINGQGQWTGSELLAAGTTLGHELSTLYWAAGTGEKETTVERLLPRFLSAVFFHQLDPTGLPILPLPPTRALEFRNSPVVQELVTKGTSERQCFQWIRWLERYLLPMRTLLSHSYLGHAVFLGLAKHFSTHSCRPNAIFVFSRASTVAARARCTVLAIRPIRPGQTITIGWIPRLNGLSYPIRQWLIREELGMECCCLLCRAEKMMLVSKKKQVHSDALGPKNAPTGDEQNAPVDKGPMGDEQNAPVDKGPMGDEQNAPVDKGPMGAHGEQELKEWATIFQKPYHKVWNTLVQGLDTITLLQLRHGFFGRLLPQMIAFGLQRFLFGLYREEFGEKAYRLLLKQSEEEQLVATPVHQARLILQSYCDRLCALCVTVRKRLLVPSLLDPHEQLLLRFIGLMITIESRALELHDNVFSKDNLAKEKPVQENYTEKLLGEWGRLARHSESRDARCIDLLDSLVQSWDKKQNSSTASTSSSNKAKTRSKSSKKTGTPPLPADSSKQAESKASLAAESQKQTESKASLGAESQKQTETQASLAPDSSKQAENKASLAPDTSKQAESKTSLAAESAMKKDGDEASKSTEVSVAKKIEPDATHASEKRADLASIESSIGLEHKTGVVSSSGTGGSAVSSQSPGQRRGGSAAFDENRFLYDRIQELTLHDPEMGETLAVQFLEHLGRRRHLTGPVSGALTGSRISTDIPRPPLVSTPQSLPTVARTFSGEPTTASHSLTK